MFLKCSYHCHCLSLSNCHYRDHSHPCYPPLHHIGSCMLNSQRLCHNIITAERSICVFVFVKHLHFTNVDHPTSHHGVIIFYFCFIFKFYSYSTQNTTSTPIMFLFFPTFLSTSISSFQRPSQLPPNTKIMLHF